MSLPLDRFIPEPDVRERFRTTVEAPAALVLEVAADLDLQSLTVVRAIFRLREKLLRSAPAAPRKPQGFLAEMRALGWGLLVEEPGRLIVCGASCWPWEASVRFEPIAAERFATWAEPGQVKIAWTLEAEALGPARTRFAHETRAVATDAEARRRFLRYWRWARFGIVAVRLLWLPAVRRAAQRRWAAGAGAERG
jgi:hypothetical protein